MHLLKKLRELFYGKRVLLEDPVFGEIEYYARPGAWYADTMHLKGKLEKVDEIEIIASKPGPTTSHREEFTQMLAGYERWIDDVELVLFNDYRKWCKISQDEQGTSDLTKVPGFPILETSRDVLNHSHFQSISVSESDIRVDIIIGWEEEHNRGVFIEGGRYAYCESS